MKKFLFPSLLILVGLGIALALYLVLPQVDREFPRKTASLTQDKRQISLFHYFSGSLSGGMTEMINTINALTEHQVVAHALDHEAFKSMIHATLTKRNPPELFTYWAGAKTQALVDQGKLEPIDDIWLATPFTDRFNTPVTEAASTYNTKKYLLPLTEHLVVFFYNKHIFE